MRHRLIHLGAVSLLALGATVYGLDHVDTLSERAGAATPPAAPPAMPVPVVAVVKRTIPVDLDYAARTESIRALTLQAKVSAYLRDQPANDGSDVKAGDLLYRLDPRDFQAALDQANAQIERDKAALAYQQSSYHRGDELSKSGYLAKDSFDQRESSLRQAEAALTADKAAAQSAQLNLDYTEIRAPFAGRLGRNQAPVGTLVSPSGTVLNTLVQLDPLYVTFNASEGDLGGMLAGRKSGAMAVEARVPGTSGDPHKGVVSFVDNAVDRSTGTVTVRASIANADLSLLPGQYVRVKVHLRDQPDALLVPQTAIGSSQLGKYVYVVRDDNKLEQVLVSLGSVEGNLVAVEGPLKPDDKVVTGNLQKIGPGMVVAPMPESPPA